MIRRDRADLGRKLRRSLHELDVRRLPRTGIVLEAHAQVAALLEREPDAFARELYAGLARVLTGKRDVGLIYEVLEQVAEEHAVWPILELALAYGDVVRTCISCHARYLRAPPASTTSAER